MLYTLTFTKDRQPFTIDNREATLVVEAPTRTEAIYSEQSVAFCNEHKVSVRGVSP